MPDPMKEFDLDMMEIYRSANRECQYNATAFLNMLCDGAPV